LQDKERIRVFEKTVLPHLGAAYNLARWLLESNVDAEDAVQEACLRAFRFFGTFRGDNGRAWLLAIVRNTCYTLREQNRTGKLSTSFDEEIHSDGGHDVAEPERMTMENLDSAALKEALEKLPAEFRETIILREFEGFSYKEVADIAGVPLGTVMSRLSRARQILRTQLSERLNKEK
jgi:RNA polymerase sigma-70 factor (ECF subfamily)